MKDGRRYRRRRFGTYRANPDGIFSKSPQPHFQAKTFNRLNGGIDRWFAPIDGQIAHCRILMAVMTMAQAVFERCSGHRDWHVEVHQFRIQASRLGSGSPTSEGMHRDGVDFSLVMMIEAKRRRRRDNDRKCRWTGAALDHASARRRMPSVRRPPRPARRQRNFPGRPQRGRRSRCPCHDFQGR
jgi:hypothetical protein